MRKCINLKIGMHHLFQQQMTSSTLLLLGQCGTHTISFFEKVSRYPQMMDWLNETEDAPANIKLWGFESGVYQWAHLQAFIKCDGEPLEDSDGESDGAKAQAKKKKTHKKAKTKTKGKSRAKAASPSGEESESQEESESVQKPSKKKIASGSRRR